MRNENILKRLLLCLFYAVMGLSCKHEISDIEKVKEQLTVTPSANDIQLNGDSLTANILNFSWSDARQLSDDHLVTYTTKLNLLGNNFGSSTTILNYEDEGVYSRSFTSEQLKNWANEKWGVKVNKSFTIEFRVIAQWEGGKTFEAPEVRTVSVNIAPIKTTNIEVDKVYLEGSAVTDGQVSLTKTLEKNNQYAFVGNLKEGDLQIPVVVEGDKYFISVNSEEQLDGSPDSVYLNENAFHWKIKKAGLYRIVLDLEAANIRIYSPDYKLEPKIVQWNDGSGNLVNTEISDLYMHGAINNWGAPIKMNCNVSLADPQILVYTNGRVGKAKFIVYGGNDNNKNLSYAFSCQPKSTTEAQELPLTLGKLSVLSGGYTKAQRDSYYTIPTGTTMLILDLRNNTILAEKR